MISHLILAFMHLVRWLNGLVVYRSEGTGLQSGTVSYHHPCGGNFANIAYSRGEPSFYWPECRDEVKTGWTFNIHDHPSECKEGAHLRYEGWFPDKESAEKALLKKMRRVVLVLPRRPEFIPMDSPEHRPWFWK